MIYNNRDLTKKRGGGGRKKAKEEGKNKKEERLLGDERSWELTSSDEKSFLLGT